MNQLLTQFVNKREVGERKRRGREIKITFVFYPCTVSLWVAVWVSQEADTVMEWGECEEENYHLWNIQGEGAGWGRDADLAFVKGQVEKQNPAGSDSDSDADLMRLKPIQQWESQSKDHLSRALHELWLPTMLSQCLGLPSKHLVLAWELSSAGTAAGLCQLTALLAAEWTTLSWREKQVVHPMASTA